MKKATIGLLMLCLLFTGCNCNIVTRSFGGTTTINLDKGQKFITMSWKEGGSLWLSSRPMRSSEEAEIITYQEHSNFGLLEGKVIVKETK